MNAACDHRSFPRIDPAIIVLVIDGERCLLGRQRSWPENRYSTIAGFVEPGESLEDAVGREVAEEANIRIARARYLGSQPWPFPNAMMIGFHADAVSREIRLNDGELADARWLSREELAAGQVALPPAYIDRLPADRGMVRSLGWAGACKPQSYGKFRSPRGGVGLSVSVKPGLARDAGLPVCICRQSR